MIKIEGTEIRGLRRRSTVKDSRLDVSALSGTSLQRLRVNESTQIGGGLGVLTTINPARQSCHRTACSHE